MVFLLFCALLVASGSIYASQAASDIDFSRPVTAKKYQGYLGQGFNANYFKRKQGDPLDKYNPENIRILKNLGFRNLRIRCVASRYDKVGYDSDTFRDEFLANLKKVVDDCIDNGIAPIVTFRHREIENRANEEDLQKYLEWWRLVAEELKDKSYLLSFNLFTEMGVEICRYDEFCTEDKDWKIDCCAESLRLNTEKYHMWTSEVISLIRGTGGNNAERILILASPKKTAAGLQPNFTDTSYLDSYMMMDWHNWAAGPNKKEGHRKYWSGEGTAEQKGLIEEAMQQAKNYTARTSIPTYQGEWQPRDNKNGALNQMEVMSFAKFFVELFKGAQIPWSLNSFDQYYDTETFTRRTEMQNSTSLRGRGKVDLMFPLNMSLVLDTILDAM